jgi:hypothetical protein
MLHTSEQRDRYGVAAPVLLPRPTGSVEVPSAAGRRGQTEAVTTLRLLHRRLRTTVHSWVNTGDAAVQGRRWGIWFAVSCVVAWACTVVLSRLGPLMGLGPVGQERLVLASLLSTLTGALAWASLEPGRFSPRAVLLGAGTGVVLWVLVVSVLV